MAADASDAVGAIVDVIARSATEIRQGLVGRRGTVDAENPSGEAQAEADVWADELLGERLLALEGVGEYASEERPAVESDGDGLSVAVDPLDGSSNLESNNAMGTVFAVYDEPLPAPGTAIRAAGYVLYGPITTLMLAHDGSVTEYELSGGERTPVREGVSLPAEPGVYGFGGRVPDWPDDFRTYARSVESELKLRYGGAMVGDVNQVVSYGGIFASPALDSRPEGKLRLLFEGAPIAHVIETAGGRSSDGSRSLLAVEPDSLHERTPVHVGNATLIDRLEAALD